MAINPFFNANYYLANNPDLVAAGLHTPEQLWEHYTTFGAQERADLLEVETINETSHLRQANDWFDVGYYLATNADLVAAGITAGQALNHYYEYGINEGRAFNPNPALQPSEFDAETYAEENPDVREHYGIEEGAELTAADIANLLKHYLAFGIYEGREGAGEEFSKAIQEASFNTINVKVDGDEGVSAVGTLANDKFVVGTKGEGDAEKNWYIDGAGGENKVVFQSNVTTATGEKGLTLRNIQSVEVDGKEASAAAGAAVTATVNGLLDSLTLTNAGNVSLTFSGVNGTADALNVDVVKSGKLTVNGLETVNLAFDEDFDGVAPFVLNANKSQGADQVVNLTGGKGVADKLALTFENASSPNLENLTIDGTALEAGLDTVKLGAQIVNVNNITIKGSKAEGNALTAEGVDASVTLSTDLVVTLVGGDKKDILTATAAIDVLTGGRGDDEFVFADVDDAAAKVKDGKIVGVDTITDFKKGDTVEVTGVITKANFKVVTLETGTGSLSLEELLLEKADGATDPILGAGDAFNFGGDAYLVVDKAVVDPKDTEELGSVSLIKLAGVDASKLDISDAGIISLA